MSGGCGWTRRVTSGIIADKLDSESMIRKSTSEAFRPYPREWRPMAVSRPIGTVGKTSWEMSYTKWRPGGTSRYHFSESMVRAPLRR